MKEIISYGRFRCRELSPHKNRGMEITYIEKGMLEWMVEGLPESVESGSIFFTLPWQVHGSVNLREPDNTIWHVLFHLEKDYPSARNAFRFPASLGFSNHEMEILSSTFASSARHGFPATPAVKDLMPSLIGELQTAHELREAHIRTLLRAILVELKRIVAGETLNTDNLSATERRARSLISSLSSACGQSWTLDQMAAYCGIRRTQLNKVFQRLTGGTPMEYLFRLRMERAKTLLRETDMKIIDIALECGYSTSQYFANAFRKTAGTTPSEYRKHVTSLTAAEYRNWKSIRFRSEEEEQRRIQEFSSSDASP